jgi:hypothetical protein
MENYISNFSVSIGMSNSSTGPKKLTPSSGSLAPFFLKLRLIVEGSDEFYAPAVFSGRKDNCSH